MSVETRFNSTLLGHDPDSTPGTAEETVRYREPVRCLCGRFAKWVGERSYYDGTYDCYSYDVQCAHCGLVTVECV